VQKKKLASPKFDLFAKIPKLGSQLNKVKRIVRTGKLSTKPVGKSKGRQFSLSLPKVNLPDLPHKGWIIVLVVFLVIAGSITTVILKINSWQITPASFGEGEIPAIVNTDSVHILLAVYNSNNGYSFIDFISLVSIDTRSNEHKAVVISPYFATSVLGSRNLKLNNLLNYTLSEGAPGVDMLSTAVEDLLGLRVDRYIMVESSQLVKILSTLGIKYKVGTNLSDQEYDNFTEGDILSDAELISYIASNSLDNADRAERQASFVENIYDNYANWLTYLRWFMFSDQIINQISTNLSRTELLNILLGISGGNLDVITVDVPEGTLIENGSDFYLRADRTAINKKIQAEFSRLELRREQARIEIYNATFTGGLASRHQRLIENVGGIVIRAGNALKPEQDTKLYVVNRDKYPETIRAIRELLRNKLILIDEEYPGNHTGEIVLVLGEDSVTEADMF